MLEFLFAATVYITDGPTELGYDDSWPFDGGITKIEYPDSTTPVKVYFPQLDANDNDTGHDDMDDILSTGDGDDHSMNAFDDNKTYRFGNVSYGMKWDYPSGTLLTDPPASLMWHQAQNVIDCTTSTIDLGDYSYLVFWFRIDNYTNNSDNPIYMDIGIMLDADDDGLDWQSGDEAFSYRYGTITANTGWTKVVVPFSKLTDAYWDHDRGYYDADDGVFVFGINQTLIDGASDKNPDIEKYKDIGDVYGNKDGIGYDYLGTLEDVKNGLPDPNGKPSDPAWLTKSFEINIALNTPPLSPGESVSLVIHIDNLCFTTDPDEVQPPTNTLATLSDPVITKSSLPDDVGTLYTFEINYTDADDDEAYLAQLYIDLNDDGDFSDAGEVISLPNPDRSDSSHDTPKEGLTYTLTMPIAFVGDGTIPYKFVFYEGGATATPIEKSGNLTLEPSGFCGLVIDDFEHGYSSWAFAKFPENEDHTFSVSLVNGTSAFEGGSSLYLKYDYTGYSDDRWHNVELLNLASTNPTFWKGGEFDLTPYNYLVIAWAADRVETDRAFYLNVYVYSDADGDGFDASAGDEVWFVQLPINSVHGYRWLAIPLDVLADVNWDHDFDGDGIGNDDGKDFAGTLGDAKKERPDLLKKILGISIAFNAQNLLPGQEDHFEGRFDLIMLATDFPVKLQPDVIDTFEDMGIDGWVAGLYPENLDHSTKIEISEDAVQGQFALMARYDYDNSPYRDKTHWHTASIVSTGNTNPLYWGMVGSRDINDYDAISFYFKVLTASVTPPKNFHLSVTLLSDADQDLYDASAGDEAWTYQLNYDAPGNIKAHDWVRVVITFDKFKDVAWDHDLNADGIGNDDGKDYQGTLADAKKERPDLLQKMVGISFDIQVEALDDDQEAHIVFLLDDVRFLKADELPRVKTREVYAGPNPVILGADSRVKFGNLNGSGTIRIFTLKGNLVREIAYSSQEVEWDLTNGIGSRINPGVYLYVVFDSEGKKVKAGKILVDSR